MESNPFTIANVCVQIVISGNIDKDQRVVAERAAVIHDLYLLGGTREQAEQAINYALECGIVKEDGLNLVVFCS